MFIFDLIEIAPGFLASQNKVFNCSEGLFGNLFPRSTTGLNGDHVIIVTLLSEVAYQ